VEQPVHGDRRISEREFYKCRLLAKNAASRPQGPRRNHRRDSLNTTTGALEARLTEIEIKLSYAEDTTEALNATVFRQQQQIDSLIQELRALREQLQASGANESRSLRDELPPHY
jgi:SlyX protein